MKKNNFKKELVVGIILLFLGTGMIQNVNGKEDTLLETIYVDSTNPNLVWSNTVLETDHNYLIQVNGTFNFDPYNRTFFADAEYVTYNTWDTADENYTYNGTIFPHVMDLLINEDDINWGEYNSNHIYTHNIIGKGSNISFVVSDWYGSDYSNISSLYINCTNNGCNFDNEGILTVKIYSIGSGNGSGSIDNKTTPGFNLILLLILILVIICIIVVSILIRKKKRKT